MAEKVKFELSVRNSPHGGLAIPWFQPLTHFSAKLLLDNCHKRSFKSIVLWKKFSLYGFYHRVDELNVDFLDAICRAGWHHNA